MSEWAQKEIELAIESEKKASEGTNEWEYGVACYESAMKAYKALLADNHSGMSIQITKNILNRLIDGKCLTPIEDTPDVWNEITESADGSKKYQCKRMSSLFKKVATDGTVTYSDIDRVSCANINNPACTYHSGFATRLIESIFPIEMPYCAPSKPFKILTEDFLFGDGDKGDYDTVAYLSVLTPDGQKIELNRYFKEDENGKFVRIDKEEWNARKAALKEH